MSENHFDGREPRIVTHTKMNNGGFNRPELVVERETLVIDEKNQKGIIKRVATEVADVFNFKKNPTTATVATLGVIAIGVATWKGKDIKAKIKGRFCKKKKADEEAEAEIEELVEVIEAPEENKKSGKKK